MEIQLVDSPFTIESGTFLRPEQYDGRPYIITPLWQTRDRKFAYPFLANTVNLINEQAGRMVFRIEVAKEQVDVHGGPLEEDQVRFRVWHCEQVNIKNLGCVNLPKSYLPIAWINEDTGKVIGYTQEGTLWREDDEGNWVLDTVRIGEEGVYLYSQSKTN